MDPSNALGVPTPDETLRRRVYAWCEGWAHEWSQLGGWSSITELTHRAWLAFPEEDQVAVARLVTEFVKSVDPSEILTEECSHLEGTPNRPRPGVSRRRYPNADHELFHDLYGSLGQLGSYKERGEVGERWVSGLLARRYEVIEHIAEEGFGDLKVIDLTTGRLAIVEVKNRRGFFDLHNADRAAMCAQVAAWRAKGYGTLLVVLGRATNQVKADLERAGAVVLELGIYVVKNEDAAQVVRTSAGTPWIVVTVQERPETATQALLGSVEAALRDGTPQDRDMLAIEIWARRHPRMAQRWGPKPRRLTNSELDLLKRHRRSRRSEARKKMSESELELLDGITERFEAKRRVSPWRSVGRSTRYADRAARQADLGLIRRWEHVEEPGHQEDHASGD